MTELAAQVMKNEVERIRKNWRKGSQVVKEKINQAEGNGPTS